MDDVLTSVGDHLGRIGGPLSFRLIMQPAIAALLAIRGGFADARAGRPPYFWAILKHGRNRTALLREGWQAVAMVFTMAIVIDAIYQLVVLHWIYPLDSVIVASLLACVPYLLVRGPANRIASAWRGREH